MTTPERGGFLSRWSRRKIEAREGLVSSGDDLPDDEPLSDDAVRDSVADALPGASTTGQVPQADVGTPEGDPPLPTLRDVQALTADSDFSPFVRGGVTPEVKNAALKKLFSDPHYNVMDRLDIYIDDYSNMEPLPESMLKRMASAHALKMFEVLDDDSEVRPTTEISVRETNEVDGGTSIEQVAIAESCPPVVTSPVPQVDLSESDGSDSVPSTASR